MRTPRVHLICNAHLDPVWQWRWEEGCAEALSTFRAAAEILREDRRLIFTHNEAILYRWVERHDPGLFREIQDLVREGRWWIGGGWFLQPDVNLPGLESLVRHITEGRRYFKEKFGAMPRVAYNFDSFGHAAGLPQLLRLGGYHMYIHMRPQEPELHLPSDLYRWRGADGTEILCLRIAVGLYHTERDNIEERLAEGTRLALELSRDVGVFWGLGNHGGGATREDLRKIDEFARKETRVEFLHSTPDLLHEALREAGESAPVVAGDLQRVFTGCYTSLSRLKRRARASLGSLAQTEALCAGAWWAGRPQYPEEELRDAWHDHLFNDFHDILPGSCTEPAERDALDLYGKASEAARRLRLEAASWGAGPAWRVPLPAVVANTNPACTRAPVEVECMLDYRPRLSGEWHLRVFRADGLEVPCQEEQPESLLPFGGWRRKVAFMADLPGVGSRAYRLEAVAGPRPGTEARPALLHEMDRKKGLVASLKPGGVECLRGLLLEPLVVKDEGDSWGADCWSYREILGRFEPVGEPRVLRSGPIRTIVESVLAYGSSRIVLRTLGYAEWPVLEFRLRIHWNEERKRLKLAVSSAFAASPACCEVPGGVILRPADGQEHVGGRWLYLEGMVGGVELALGVVNSGQHGFDLEGGELRLSVLRSAAYCHEKGFPLGDSPARKYMDQGVHEARILVTAGPPESVSAALPGLADWLDAPPAVYSHLSPRWTAAEGEGSGKGSEPGLGRIMSLEPAGVRLVALKRSSDGRALVARLHEARGVAAKARLVLARPAVEVTLELRPCEIKTLRIEKDGTWREIPLE